MEKNNSKGKKINETKLSSLKEINITYKFLARLIKKSRESNQIK